MDKEKKIRTELLPYSVYKSINQSSLYAQRQNQKNKINEIKYNNTAHIKYTSDKKKIRTHTHIIQTSVA